MKWGMARRWVWLERTVPGAARGWVKFECVCVFMYVLGGALSLVAQRLLHRASIFTGQVCHIVSLRIGWM